MAFKLDDIVIDRIQMAVAEDSSGNLLYTLTQLSEATIETTAEAKEATSAEGSLIKKFYQSKAGTFTAQNAMINLNVVAAASGTSKTVWDGSAMSGTDGVPKIVVVKNTTGAKYETDPSAERLDSENDVRVYALANNGTLGKKYTKSTTASATAFAVSVDSDTHKATITMPTDSSADRFVVKYPRTVANGVKIVNSADKFPSTVKLTLKALCIDPCTPDTLRACYIILPSFQVSPELSIGLTTDSTLDYKGDLQVDYCSADKELYTIVMCADDEEE